MAYAHPLRHDDRDLAGIFGYGERGTSNTLLRIAAPHPRSLPLRTRIIDLMINLLCLIALAPAIIAVWIAIRRSAYHPAVTGRKGASLRAAALVTLKAADRFPAAAPLGLSKSSHGAIAAQA